LFFFWNNFFDQKHNLKKKWAVWADDPSFNKKIQNIFLFSWAAYYKKDLKKLHSLFLERKTIKISNF
jgi:hypothetical protein